MTSEHQTKAIVVVVGERQNNKSYCYRGGEHQTVAIVCSVHVVERQNNCSNTEQTIAIVNHLTIIAPVRQRSACFDAHNGLSEWSELRE